MKIPISEIKKIAKKRLDKGASCHSWDHAERVLKKALLIGTEEGADLAVVTTAALFHDIKKTEEMRSKKKICHAVDGAKETRKILTKLKLPQKFINQVSHCIKAHRFRNDISPQTIEAKVLSDADKIDSLGAVGIGRAFLYVGKVGARLHNSEVKNILKTKEFGPDDTLFRGYMVKLCHLPRGMYTKTGKKIARERALYIKKFINRLEKEIAGKL